MRIILDVDSVVADLVGALLDVAGKEDRALANEYDWFEKYPDHDDAQKTRRAMSSPNFWQNLPLIPGALEGVDFLRTNGHSIVWCTAPYEKCFGWLDVRREWLDKHFGLRKYNDALVATEDKYLVDGVVFIDDRIDFVDAWEKVHLPRGGIGFIYQSELNLHSGRELVTWNDIVNMRLFDGSKYEPTP